MKKIFIGLMLLPVSGIQAEGFWNSVSAFGKAKLGGVQNVLSWREPRVYSNVESPEPQQIQNFIANPFNRAGQASYEWSLQMARDKAVAAAQESFEVREAVQAVEVVDQVAKIVEVQEQLSNSVDVPLAFVAQEGAGNLVVQKIANVDAPMEAAPAVPQVANTFGQKVMSYMPNSTAGKVALAAVGAAVSGVVAYKIGKSFYNAERSTKKTAVGVATIALMFRPDVVLSVGRYVMNSVPGVINSLVK